MSLLDLERTPTEADIKVMEAEIRKIYAEADAKREEVMETFGVASTSLVPPYSELDRKCKKLTKQTLELLSECRVLSSTNKRLKMQCDKENIFRYELIG